MATWEEVGEEVRAIADAQEAERYARDPRVVAIRADEKIGRGTCSVIDECWTDKELVEMLDHMSDGEGGHFAIISPRLAVMQATYIHKTNDDSAAEIESTAF